MNLIAIPARQLRLNEALPFGLRDAAGQVLLAAGRPIDDAQALARLQSAALFADADDVDGRSAGLGSQWGAVAAMLDRSLRELQPNTGWMTRLMAVRERALALAAQRPDAALYHHVYTAGHRVERYSSQHSVLCLLIARETGMTLRWDEALVHSLEHAALTMNCAMHKLQDDLARLDSPVTPELRAAIHEHAARSAKRLLAAGVADPLWVEIVRLHHDDSLRQEPLDSLTPAQRGARLLRRVDIFTAKLSRRLRRPPMTPVQAAREACLGADGLPDEIGAALLKSVGMYPPGSFVTLANGETGIVVARGPRANLPVVAALVDAGGAPLRELVLRETGDPRFTVRSAVAGGGVKVVPPHELLMAMV